ncbi:MAG: hypothetical protein HEP71_30225 [Roseivirga sp.]|nr:hypothetical protein [Roseivirga sp.]
MKKLMLIILMSTLALSIYAQADQHWLPKKLSISVKEMPLEEVLKELEKEMDGVVFAYSPGAFDVKKKVSIKAEEVPLNEILHRIFKNQNLECAELSGKIFLKKKKRSSSGRQSSVPVRRKRVLNASVSNLPVIDAKTKTANKARATSKKDQPDSNEVSEPVVITKSESSEQPAKEEQKETTTPVQSPSKEVMDIIEEMTNPGRVRSAPTHRPVNPIQKEQAFANFDRSRPRQFSVPDLPPVPIDSTSTEAEMPRAKKEKKKREKKEKPPREPEEKKLRLYGASTTALTGIGDDAAIKMGGRAMWLKNSRFGIGLAGYAIQGPNTNDAALSGDSYKLAGGYGGLMLEYNLNPNKAIHLSFPVLIAGGAMTYALQDINLGNVDRLLEDQRVIAIVEPGAMLEFNVIKYVKVALDVSYRYASHSELNYKDSGDVILAGGGLNTFSGGVTVKFGIF